MVTSACLPAPPQLPTHLSSGTLERSGLPEMPNPSLVSQRTRSSAKLMGANIVLIRSGVPGHSAVTMLLISTFCKEVVRVVQGTAGFRAPAICRGSSIRPLCRPNPSTGTQAAFLSQLYQR